MVITEISPQKRKGRYNIYVDGEFFSGIDSLSLAEAGYKVGSIVSREELDSKVLESEVRSAFDRLAAYLSVPRSKKQIKDKLIKCGYNDAAISGAIKRAEEYGYISDSEFAAMLVNSKPLSSKLELKSKLFEKGIDAAIIKDAVKDISLEDETNRALILAEKYMKNKQVNLKTLNGLNGFLLRKGFFAEVVNKVIRMYKINGESVYVGD